jgi:hypothetical protein
MSNSSRTAADKQFSISRRTLLQSLMAVGLSGEALWASSTMRPSLAQSEDPTEYVPENDYPYFGWAPGD